MLCPHMTHNNITYKHQRLAKKQMSVAPGRKSENLFYTEKQQKRFFFKTTTIFSSWRSVT